ncbi:MAG: CoA-binding protein [bacterium]|nr:CoA-binding protein [bacterium]
MPDCNPVDEEMKEILGEAKTIAVVGLSDNTMRDSNKVAKYLQDRGYRIIPVNPTKTEILGEKCYPDLASIPDKIDIVDIFRKLEAVPAIVDEAIAVKPKAIWLQLGLAHNPSAEKVRKEGIKIIQSKCIKVQHYRLMT